MAPLLVFACFAALALVSAVAVVSFNNPVHATLSLVVTLFSVAVLFFTLGAPFIGTLQILVYAGAIVVLFLFVIMLLNIQKEEHREEGQKAQRILALLAAGLFGGLCWPLLSRAAGGTNPGPIPESLHSIQEFSRDLFTTYLLHFEIVGLLLLVAVIAATVVARRPVVVVDAGGAGASGESIGKSVGKSIGDAEVQP